MNLEPTSSQTIGPYLHIGMTWLNTDRVAPPGCAGQHVTLSGHVLDGDGQPVTDAMVELWQADANGRYAHPEDTRGLPTAPGFRGFGRVPTDGEGRFRFYTIKPGPVPDPQGGLQAPHLLVSVFMRGLLKQAVTRVYFPGEPLNESDLVLRSVPPERRATLIAQPSSDGALEWDIALQGEHETVFFDC